MGMPIRGKISLLHTSSDIEASFGSMTKIPFGSRWPRKGHHSASGPSWMVTVSYSDDTFEYNISQCLWALMDHCFVQ